MVGSVATSRAHLERVLVIVPAFREEASVAEVVGQIRALGKNGLDRFVLVQPIEQLNERVRLGPLLLRCRSIWGWGPLCKPGFGTRFPMDTQPW
jgi:hypothetical protein